MNRPETLKESRYEFAALVVRDLIDSLPGRIAFDVGAGACVMRKPIVDSGLQWEGFDISPQSTDVKRWDLDYPAPDGCKKAAVVLLLDVMEHLLNPGLGLQHVAEVMLPNGRLILTTPNPRWGRSRLHAVGTGFLGCFTQNDLDVNGHVFPLWPHVLEYMLSRTGFVVERYCTLDGWTTWPRGPITVRYPLRVGHALLNKIIELGDPTACGMSYGVVARKEDRSPLMLNVFYAEPDADRWLPFDRYPRRLIRRVVRGRRRPGGMERYYLNLADGLRRAGIPFRFNDFSHARRNPDELVGIVGKGHLLRQYDWRNPIVFGPAVFSHPYEDLEIFNRAPILKVLVSCAWLQRMYQQVVDLPVEVWPAGIDTYTWQPSPDTAKTIDVLVYDKIRWKREKYELGTYPTYSC